MAAYEVLLLNTAIPQIQAAQSGDTYLVPRDIAINATAIISANSATDALRITQTGAGNAILVEDSANPDSTPFVVTATGNVGIGTNNPAQKLDVRGGSIVVDAAAAGLNPTVFFDHDNFASGTRNYIQMSRVTEAMLFGVANSDRMTLDSSGNLGLGVTPSAWWSGMKALQVGSGAALYDFGSSNVALGSNLYFDGTNSRYINTDFASYYQQNNGIHIWATAPSGTANSASVTSGASYTVVALGSSTLAQWQAFFNDSSNNPLTVTPTLGQVLTGNATGTLLGGGLVTQNISFTQAMTLDASGNLQLATTTSSNRTITVGGTNATIALAGSNGGIYFGAAGTPVGSGGFGENAAIARAGNTNFHITGSVAGDLCIAAEGTKSILFGTSSSSGSTSERARITSGGDFGLGVTSTNQSGAGSARVLTIGGTSQAFTEYVGTTGSGLATGSLHRNASALVGGIVVENATGNQGIIEFSTNNGTTYAEKARISSDGTFRVKGAGTAGTTDAVQFSGSAPASAMTLDADGDLGIGTSSPNKRLTVKSATNDVEVLRINAPGEGGGTQAKADIGFGYYDGVSEASAAIGFEEFGTSSAGGSLLFKTRPDGAADSTRPTERARITSGGEFQIGPFGGNGTGTISASPAGTGFTNQPGSDLVLQSGNATGAGSSIIKFLTPSPGSSGTSTNTATERARITSGGYFKASNNGTYVSSTGVYHELDQSANQETLVLNSTNASQTFTTLLIQSARNTTNNTYYAIDYYNTGAAAYKFRVADSGDVTNTNGTYGTISDAKMKTDIVDVGSQWADIKALRFRKFKMKDDPSGLVQLGVVAQEVEQTSPGLVDEHADKDAEGNDLGTTTKSVKTSVLLMKAAVALQEAMARIEKLEAEVAALKGA